MAILACTYHLHLIIGLFSESTTVMYATVSATGSVSCSFEDVDICGYQDLSNTDMKWSQIHNQSKSILAVFMHDHLLCG